ncbi:MAG TPA: hypothetical protein VHC46_04430 [Thermodesulfobacteriota bacterium]|nr:hypothetical protein [Thermodesulfobacteriota bacterium]
MKSAYRLFAMLLLSGAFIIPGLTAAPKASAQVVFTNDEAQFFADNPRLLVQTFNSAISSGCDVPFDSTNNAGCFPPGALLPGVVYDVSPSHEFLDIFGVNFDGTSGNPSKAIGPDNHTDTLDMIFEIRGVTAVGLKPGCFVLTGVVCQRTITISVYGEGDELLGSTQVDASSLFDDFVGIESDVPIAKISVKGPDLGPDSGFHAISELDFSQGVITNVPALSELGMISAAAGLGLAGTLFVLRRKRNNTV